MKQVEVPSLILFLTASTLWTLSLAVGTITQAQGVKYGGLLLISSLASYMQFTVAHECAHNTFSKNPWINETIGWIAAWFLGPSSSFPLFRHNHLLHHRY